MNRPVVGVFGILTILFGFLYYVADNYERIEPVPGGYVIYAVKPEIQAILFSVAAVCAIFTVVGIVLEGHEVPSRTARNGYEQAPSNQRVPFQGPADYLVQRAEILKEAGVPYHETLFPFLSKKGKVGCWSQAMWGKLKAHIELVSGVRFRWKDFRPTLAQSCKDAGAPIEAISKVLRHSSGKTTERYYARIRPESAFSQVKSAWQARKPLQVEIPNP